MPRRLLRDRRIVLDDWHYLDETAEPNQTGLIVPFDRWVAEREHFLTGNTRLGVLLEPAHAVEQLAGDLPRLSLIAVRFPSPSEGRGYTQGRLLRERWQFAGELRAIDYVREDLLFFLARCGFNAFQMADGDLDGALGAFHTFSAEYQASNDAGLAAHPRHRT
jgi:uncharacterized protein (DUF934 family)